MSRIDTGTRGIAFYHKGESTEQLYALEKFDFSKTKAIICLYKMSHGHHAREIRLTGLNKVFIAWLQPAYIHVTHTTIGLGIECF